MADELETRETPDMIASDKVSGTAVYNTAGEKLGTVEKFMVNKFTGQVEYAVLAFGGLFGIGHKHFPLPWGALTYHTDQGGYVVNLSREQLEGAPSYEAEGEAPTYDRDYGQTIYSYYGLVYQ
jgi:sporulation protein YlmC with PRC-barrel domain